MIPVSRTLAQRAALVALGLSPLLACSSSESQGLPEFTQVVDSQVTHDVGVSWTVSRTLTRVTSTFEIDNLTDAKVYDNFGLQRPGRGFYVKVSGEI